MIRGDDYYLEAVAPKEHDNSLSSNPPANLLDALGALGNYTTSFDVTFGHTDSFTHSSDAPLLENKVSFPLGEPLPSVNLDVYLENGRVPPAGLAYPRYKVATVSFAVSDVELGHTLWFTSVRQLSIPTWLLAQTRH